MASKLFLVLIAVAALTAGGCRKEPPPPAETPQVKITPENLDSELDKMEAEIEADIAAEQ